MNMIYSKENIFRKLQDTKKFYKEIFNEEYFIVDIIYGFNSLTMEEQDFYLQYKANQKNKYYEENRLRMRRINDKMRNSIINNYDNIADDVKIRVKNPEAQENMRKKKKTNQNSELVQGSTLIKNKIIEISDILDDRFADDEKRVIKMKYSEEPPLNNMAVAHRLCIDTDEVLETTNKLYRAAYDAHKKLVLMRESSHERKS